MPIATPVNTTKWGFAGVAAASFRLKPVLLASVARLDSGDVKNLAFVH